MQDTGNGDQPQKQTKQTRLNQFSFHSSLIYAVFCDRDFWIHLEN